MLNSAAHDFDDIADDFDNEMAAPDAPAAPQVYLDKCPKCRGTGFYRGPSSHGSRCFKCDGRGTLAFKTSPEQRAQAKATATRRKERTGESNIAAFEASNPDIAAWWKDSTFGFAISMREAVAKYGDLTENQLVACIRCVEGTKARQQERTQAAAGAVERAAAAPTVDIQPIIDSFTRAHNQGIKHPKMNVDGMQFERAPDHGKNPGAVYIKNDGEYLGKIMGGRFMASRDCNDERQVEILKVCADPLAAAVAFGKKYGKCSICKRDLSDPVSIERGIGPICAERMGW